MPAVQEMLKTTGVKIFSARPSVLCVQCGITAAQQEAQEAAVEKKCQAKRTPAQRIAGGAARR